MCCAYCSGSAAFSSNVWGFACVIMCVSVYVHVRMRECVRQRRKWDFYRNQVLLRRNRTEVQTEMKCRSSNWTELYQNEARVRKIQKYWIQKWFQVKKGKKKVKKGIPTLLYHFVLGFKYWNRCGDNKNNIPKMNRTCQKYRILKQSLVSLWSRYFLVFKQNSFLV